MQKLYTSTRNKKTAHTPKETILKGIAEDGGLFVNDWITECKLPLEEMLSMTYEEMAETVLQLLLPDFTEKEVKKCVKDAYENKFNSKEITSLFIFDGFSVLELFHGPTCAFKDVGLRMLPQLMRTSLQNQQENVMILTATSGDTGKAALEGFLDVDQTGIMVFYPKNGVSDIQEMQMITTKGKNTCVCSIDGNFDDVQSVVKQIFQDQEINGTLKKEKIILSSANSINIGRLIPQIVYYVYAYIKMVKANKIQFMDKINFCVPTGNFGNVLAGYYAKMMGLPVHRFIVASNANNVLYDFLNTGIYDRNREFYKTVSPSMDILISSNLERLLYFKSGKDSSYITSLMKELDKNGKYKVSDDIYSSIKEDFVGGYCSDEECISMIQEVYQRYGYVMDPHTAVGYKVLKEYQSVDDEYETVLLSTASPYKFASVVYKAIYGIEEENEFTCMKQLEEKTGLKIPSSLNNLPDLEIRHTSHVKKEEMKGFVIEKGKSLF